MATHDYIISNASGAAVRADLNNALAAIVSNNSNATSPATTYAFQFWADTTTGQLKIRNAANSAWITLMELDGTMLMEDGTVSAPGLAFASDLNTGFFRSAADKINFATGGAERLEIGSSEVVFNDPSNDVDFRVESNGNTHMLFVDAGNNCVGVGTNSPAVLLDVADKSNNEPKLRISTGTATNFFQISRSTSTGHYTLASEENGSSIILATDPDGTGAVDRLTIDRNGNVGIGESSMDALLVIKGNSDANTTPSIRLKDGSDTREAWITNASGDLMLNVGGNDNVAHGTLRLFESGILDYAQGAGSRLRIDSSGRLLVGTTTSQSTDAYIQNYRASGKNLTSVQSNSLANGEICIFEASAKKSGGSNNVVELGLFKHNAIANPSGYLRLPNASLQEIFMWNDTSNNFRTSTVSSHIGTTSGTVVGTQTSDERLKNVGANVAYGLAEVKQLQPKQYALKAEPDTNKLGFIAQQVESIIPEAVYDTNEELDGHQEGDRTKLGMEYVQLIPVLVNAIKELSAEVDTLKTKVAALEAG